MAFSPPNYKGQALKKYWQDELHANFCDFWTFVTFIIKRECNKNCITCKMAELKI